MLPRLRMSLTATRSRLLPLPPLPPPLFWPQVSIPFPTTQSVPWDFLRAYKVCQQHRAFCFAHPLWGFNHTVCSVGLSVFALLRSSFGSIFRRRVASSQVSTIQSVPWDFLFLAFLRPSFFRLRVASLHQGSKDGGDDPCSHQFLLL